MKAFTCILLLPCVVQAQVLMHLVDPVRGEVSLYAKRGGCPNGWHRALAFDADIVRARGCWRDADHGITVRWTDSQDPVLYPRPRS